MFKKHYLLFLIEIMIDNVLGFSCVQLYIANQLALKEYSVGYANIA